ncbi:MAG: hypothetical protein M9941_18630 [Anaerolineae bacterium]|nr:hypothetical protein [Anaerolineae bacterium]
MTVSPPSRHHRVTMSFSPRDHAQSDGRVKLARTITHIISPPTMFAALGWAIAFYAYPTFVAGVLWGALHGLLISLLPIIYVVWLLQTGRITDISMTRKERRIPYFVGAGFALFAFVLFAVLDQPDVMRCLILFEFLALLIMGIINIWWQISNHATSVTGMVLISGAVFGSTVFWLMSPLILIVCGLRYYLKRHTVAQLLGGVALATMLVLGLQVAGCF